jgi:hypothetical protein
MNSSKLPHQADDQYQFVQNLGSGSVKVSGLLNLVGNQLQLFPDKDAAIILSDHPKPATDYHLKTGQRE